MSKELLDTLRVQLKPLVEDAIMTDRLLEKEDNQFKRRIFIRSFFAFVEGSIWCFKQNVLNEATFNNLTIGITEAEYALLSDKTYDLKSNGETKENNKHLKLPENLRFTFTVLQKAFGI